MLLLLLSIAGCGGGGGVYYGHHYGVDPWYYHGGYVRDRVHVVSDEEVRALERADSAAMPEPVDMAPDMGMGDMGMGDMGMDMGGFD